MNFFHRKLMLSTLGLAVLIAGCGKGSGDREIQQGSATPAKLLFSDMPRYEYGVRLVGTTTDKAILLTNSGGLPATDLKASFHLSVHYSFKGGTFPGERGTCNTQLDPAKSCEVVVSFSPQYSGHFEQPLSVLFFDGIINQRTTGPYLYGDGI